MKFRFLALSLVWAPAFLFGAAPAVDKVEPPNWWPDYTINPVRLLIHGTNLTGATVKAPGALKISNVRVNQAGTYLFADVTIPRKVAPGEYPLLVSTPAGSASAPFRLDAQFSATGHFQGFSSDDVLYLIMPDRFANGDPANDDPAISRGLFDPANPRRYHGGDFAGIIARLPYLKSLGVTALWLTPWYDNTNALNRQQAVNGQAIADYHGYGATDYYGVEEHFGTLETLQQLVEAAHKQGIKIIQDQVANHVGPGHPWVQDAPKETWFHGTVERHLNETWQIFAMPDATTSASLQRGVTDGWFMNVLPDLNQEDEDVAAYEIQNALWWVGVTGIDGIRQDTVPYVPAKFWHAWTAALREEYPNLRTVGEVFDGDPAIPSYFQHAVGTVFDFPMYFNIREVFAKGGSFEAAAKTLAKDRYYENPQSLVTFLGLHDVARFMNEPGATSERLKLAFTYLTTLRGTPMIYYGDEIGMPGGDDPDNRRDFPVSAFEPAGRNPSQQAVFQHLQKLLEIRSRTAALRRGRFIDLAVTEKTWAYARVLPSSPPVFVVLNNGDAPADIEVPYSVDGVYNGQLAGGELRIVDGKGTVKIPAKSGEIFLRR